MLTTVEKTKSRIENLMLNILNNETQAIYSKVSSETPEEILYNYASETDELVVELSGHLEDKEYCISAISSRKPEVFFTMFIRYHFLINYLRSKNPKSTANMPEGDSEFFIVMLNDFWNFALR